MPIDPTMAVRGGEWSIGGVGKAAEAEGVGGAAPTQGAGSFGEMLAGQIDGLQHLQTDAADASRSLADGTATDPSTAVVAVERARLAMQLAAQIRTKGLEAFNDVFHTTV
jgi:flagellar hook-basal body complex protein FliE